MSETKPRSEIDITTAGPMTLGGAGISFAEAVRGKLAELRADEIVDNEKDKED